MFAVLSFVPLTLVALLFDGVILTFLWNWFGVPILHLPYLTVVHAMGLTLLAMLFMGGSSKTDDEEWFPNLLTNIICKVLLLIIAFIVHLMM